MDEHDESLAVGIAAGLDIPTAMVLSEQEETPQPEKGCGLALFIISGAAGIVFACLML